MDATVSDPVVGRLLDGRYTVTERLAAGGMATVYVAHDNRLDRPVALKVMHPAFAHDPDYVARFHREATAAARLNSPHVVSILDQGTDDGPGGRVIYLVMELVRGRTLRMLLAERGCLPTDLTVRITEGVVAALAAAHLAGIIHRDIKPENILLGDDGRVKVADFGLARPVSTGTPSSASLTHGVLIGTIGYLAPEQVVDGVADTRSDVYAAGIVVFEMLTGRQPHAGATPMAVAYQHVHGDVPPPSSLRGDIGPALDAFVLAATDRDPDRRPADGAAMLAELHRLLPQLPYDTAPAPASTALLGAPAPAAGMGGSPPARTSVFPGDAFEQHSASEQRASEQRASEQRAFGGALGGFDWQPPSGADWQPPNRGGGSPRRGSFRYGLAALVAAGIVILLVSAGMAMGGGTGRRVPSLTGMDRAAVQRAVTTDHLKVVFDPAAASSSIAAGKVLTQTPQAGVTLANGGTVHVVLSSGPDMVVVPDVSKLSQQDATTRLLQSRLGVSGVTQRNDATVPQGQALGTDPAAGTRQRAGSKVTLVLSAGAPQITVPTDLVGEDADTAAAELTTLGLTVRQQGVESLAGTGTVVRTSPDPGQQVNSGETVTLFISTGIFGDTGQQLVAIPTDLKGQSGHAAQQELENLGLKVSFFGRHNGKVHSVNPGEGSMVPVGSQVTLNTAF